ncbi:MAG: hypothetical protein JNL01_03550 [Bdellovibrionales bacterium]|nr:hypothetical protein [Bdellovibrionales bacterium]
MKQGFLGLVLVLSLAACGGDGSGAAGAGSSQVAGWACDMTVRNSVCLQYTGSKWQTGSEKATAQEGCAKGSATTSGVVASTCKIQPMQPYCLVEEGTPSEFRAYYYLSVPDSVILGACKNYGGKWVNP